MNAVRLAIVLLSLCATCACAAAEEAERVEFKLDGKQRMALGNILVEAEDGGILLESRNQTIWPLQPDEIVSRKRLDESPEPLDHQELAKAIQQELGRGFRVHNTKHYVICYNTSTEYAKWCGAMFERLHRGFNAYWDREGIDLHKTQPLVALIFRDKNSYQAYGRQELGKSIDSILGYYSYKTNRIAMYDLLGGRQVKASMMNKYMRAERTVATVIHEATHQIAFNSGLHKRFADIPLWLSEGLAIYFETPDLSSNKGWKTIGKVNHVRLKQFAQYAQRRKADSLLSLISSDERFQKLGLARDAYAESWAFCYYLVKHHSDEFADYLQILQAKEPLNADMPEERIADFVEAFGKPPQAFNTDFMRRTSKLR